MKRCTVHLLACADLAPDDSQPRPLRSSARGNNAMSHTMRPMVNPGLLAQDR